MLEPGSTDSLGHQHCTKKLSPKIALHFKVLCKNKAALPLSCQHGLFSRVLADCAFFFQFDLVCGNDWKITLAQVVYMFGILLGASTSGMISDKFGRKKTIIFFSTAMSAFSIAVAFANCYDFFVFLRWGLAFSSGMHTKNLKKKS